MVGFLLTMKMLEKLKVNRSDSFERRIHEIDLFRGFLILIVIFDHLLWFFRFYIFKDNAALLWYWESTWRSAVREIILLAFLFTCGISCYFSHNNKKRGLYLLGITLGITIITHLIQLMPMFNDRVVIIDFNILGVIALSILLYTLCEKLDTKNLWLITGILIMFYFFILVSIKTIGGSEYLPFRSVLYSPFNPVKEGFVGDYLSLFPYVIALFLGVIFARNFYKNKVSLFKKKGNWEKPICFLGRHTLIIYIAHEVIFTLIFMGIGALL